MLIHVHSTILLSVVCLRQYYIIIIIIDNHITYTISYNILQDSIILCPNHQRQQTMGQRTNYEHQKLEMRDALHWSESALKLPVLPAQPAPLPGKVKRRSGKVMDLN